MAEKYHILYWRDIPSMVKAKIGRKRLSRPLPDRFMEAIDAAAMKTGRHQYRSVFSGLAAI